MTHVHSSNIFAKIPVDVVFCHFDSQHGNEYFMNLHNMRHLTNIKFSLTNSHGLPLSKVYTNNQEPKIDFTMVLKVDIVEKNAPYERHTADGSPSSTSYSWFLSHAVTPRARYA